MAAPLHTVNEEVVIDEGIVSPPAPSVNQAAEGQKCTGKLTHQHVVAGWREGFSTTEQRPYFYNVYSRESVWALPCPATSPAGQAEKSGTPVDVLAAAVDELTRGEPPKPERAAKSQTPDEVPQASEGGPDCKAGTSGNEGNERRGKKRAYPADPDQEENENPLLFFDFSYRSSHFIHAGDRPAAKPKLPGPLETLLTRFIPKPDLYLLSYRLCPPWQSLPQLLDSSLTSALFATARLNYRFARLAVASLISAPPPTSPRCAAGHHIRYSTSTTYKNMCRNSFIHSIYYWSCMELVPQDTTCHIILRQCFLLLTTSKDLLVSF